MARAIIAAFLIVAAGGCVGVPGSPPLGPGENVWGPMRVDGPLFVPNGSALTLGGVLYLGGPLRVEGELRGTDTTIHFDDGVDPRIEVFGGKVDFERVSVRAAVSLDIRKGANVSWGKGEIAYATFTLADGAVVNISEIRLAPPSSGTPQLDIHDSVLTLTNSTLEGARIVATGTGVARLVNVGTALDAFGGDGRVERVHTVRIRPTTALGGPIPGLAVRAEAGSTTFPTVEAVSGDDGDAYVWLADAARVDGAIVLANPWRLSAGGGPPGGLAFVTSSDEVFTVVVTDPLRGHGGAAEPPRL